MDKSKLEKLIDKNKIYIRHKKWAENELLQDCLNLLKDVQLIETEQDICQLNHSMCTQFPINEYRHIDGSYELSREELCFFPNRKYYIFWDDMDLPAILCSGTSILRCLDDIFAVSFDTYIFSEDFSEIIHSDDLGVLWRYF